MTQTDKDLKDEAEAKQEGKHVGHGALGVGGPGAAGQQYLGPMPKDAVPPPPENWNPEPAVVPGHETQPAGVLSWFEPAPKADQTVKGQKGDGRSVRG